MLFTFPDVQDSGSKSTFKDETGIQACGPRVYALKINNFVKQDSASPQSLKLKTSDPNDQGTQTAFMQVTLQKYAAAPLEVPIICSIAQCKVTEIKPENPKLSPSKIYINADP